MLLTKLRQRLRWARMQASIAVGLDRRWLRDRPGLSILIYHGVLPALPRRIHARFVTTAQLDAHCAYFKRHFQVIDLAQAFAGDYDPQRLAVAVTFDDGYRNNLHHALPVLQRHGLPATFFVTAARAAGQDILWPDLLDIASATTVQPIEVAGMRFHKDRKGEYVDAAGQRLKQHCKAQGPAFVQQMVAAFADAPFRQDPAWDGYWQLMDAEELRMLADTSGMAVGGHGSLHHNLDRMPVAEAVEDVQLGLQWLAHAIGKPITSFAYPDGGYSPALVGAMAGLGVTQQLLTEYRFGDQDDPRLRERFTIHPFLPTKVLMAEILRGSYF
jgi:peptidoglycan/xylan/chitin deacetylase (PgdA/CDA1 family)